MTTLTMPITDSHTSSRWQEQVEADSLPIFASEAVRKTFTLPTTIHWGVFEVEDSTDLEPEGFFGLALSQYYSARGCARKKERQELLSWMQTSTNQDRKITQVLEEVAKLHSQEVMEAAIDLLAPLGNVVVSKAVQWAFAEKVSNENAAFVLASAAGRASEDVLDVLLCSRHDAIREAAVELAASLPSALGKTTLRRISTEDKSPALRARATDLLEDFN